MRVKRIDIALCVVALLLLAGCSSSDARQDWPVQGGNFRNQRYAAIDDINRQTISRLGLAWYYQFDTDRGQEATPIMVDGTLYVSTAWNEIFAFDPRDGRLLWRFDPLVPRETLSKSCCDAISRGVAVAEGRVFAATLDGRLIALDSKTGKQIWSITTVDRSKSYTITGAPVVAGHLVLIGNAGGEYGVRGYISAYDITDGSLRWRFYTVPNPEGKSDNQPSDRPLKQLAEPTWFGNAWRQSGGGGTVWDSIVYDPELDMVYFGVGNGTPHHLALRSEGKGDNLFLSSIIAVKADTGEYVWHYQTTPGDSWDYTATQQIMLIDREIDGKPRKLLMQAPKNGFFYVIDRTNGKLLSADTYSPVNWAGKVSIETGRPDVAPEARVGNGSFLQYPGYLGAHSWHPMAYSPDTGLVYIPAQIMGQAYKFDPGFVFRPGHMNAGSDMRSLALPDDPQAIAAIQNAYYGELIAWNPLARKVQWKIKHHYVVNGGVLSTAGGLVFQGDAEGVLRAYDASTGKTLWSYDTGNGIVAPPISYKLGGRQYIALMVGWGGPAAQYGTIVPYRRRLPGRLVVFALDGRASLPALPKEESAKVDLGEAVSSGNVEAGLDAYNDNCLVCHGFSARGNYTADLRRSAYIKSPSAFRSVVIDGALEDYGMVSWREYVSPDDAENIRAYLLTEARKLQDAEASHPAIKNVAR